MWIIDVFDGQCSTRNNKLRGDNMRPRSRENEHGKHNISQHASYINDTVGIRERRGIINCNGVNESGHQKNIPRNVLSDNNKNVYANGTNNHGNAINARKNVPSIVTKEIITKGNGVAQQKMSFDGSRKNSFVNKQRSIVSVQNIVNGSKMAVVAEETGKTHVPDLRYLLRPTVTQKRQENNKNDYDNEDINGPYNFRQLLRPAEYLPTESLRKRKGGFVINGGPLLRDKVAGKNVKRKAPPVPIQNKIGPKTWSQHFIPITFKTNFYLGQIDPSRKFSVNQVRTVTYRILGYS